MQAIVVDDSSAMRRILTQMLDRLGFETFEAADGVAALEVLKDTGPLQLALVDWNMPHMNGIDLVRRIRVRRDFDTMRIVMVTTESDTTKVVEALGSGVDEYVMKPFTEEIITSKLELLELGGDGA